MQLIILLLFVFFGAVAFMQYTKKVQVNAGAFDELIRQLLVDYKTLRSHTDDIGTSAFAIGWAQKKHKKGLRDDTESLAIRILDEKGAKRDGAAALGMDVIEIGDKYYYQLLVKPKEQLSDALVTAILVRLKEKLERRYPDDLVNIADTYITVVAGGKNLLNLIDVSSRKGSKSKRRKETAQAQVPQQKIEAAGELEDENAAADRSSEPKVETPAEQPDEHILTDSSVMKGERSETKSAARVNFGPKPLMFPQPVLIIATYDEDGRPNAMNAAWGITTDFSEITISLSEHKTTDNLAVCGAFTVSMATEDYVTACDYVGIESGRKVPDKFVRAGFHAIPSSFVDAPLIAELPMAIECKVKSFADGILTGEIVNVCADEIILTDGKIDVRKLRPISFDPMGNAYFGVGDKVGRAFSDGAKLKHEDNTVE
jgi:flavin reductase (DIM6/NTAB) family NADH-FMN oxidoreductase RutF